MQKTTIILRVEGACVFALATWMYAYFGQSWWLFAALFLVPDISFAGYLLGPVRGAAIYNLAHTYVLPLVLIALGITLSRPTLLSIGVIWTAHCGVDRAVGYGLKRDEGFKVTHLGQL